MKKKFMIVIIAILLCVIIMHCFITVEVHHIVICNDPDCKACLEIKMMQNITELFTNLVISYFLIYTFLAILYEIIEKVVVIKKYCLVDLKIRLNE